MCAEIGSRDRTSPSVVSVGGCRRRMLVGNKRAFPWKKIPRVSAKSSHVCITCQRQWRNHNKLRKGEQRKGWREKAGEKEE